jgi:hypothetical protein
MPYNAVEFAPFNVPQRRQTAVKSSLLHTHRKGASHPMLPRRRLRIKQNRNFSNTLYQYKKLGVGVVRRHQDSGWWLCSQVILDKLGIKHGCITTIHNITNTQTVVDAVNSKKDDLRRARCV